MPVEIPDINWSLLMPQLVIVTTLLIVLVFDMIDAISKKVLGWMTIVGAGIALWKSIEMLQAGTNLNQFKIVIRSSLTLSSSCQQFWLPSSQLVI